MADLSQVTYCGLYCGLCAARNRIPPAAQTLRAHMRREGWEFWGREVPGFEAFWAFLGHLADGAARCSCREGQCGPGFCSIRRCAQERGVDICPQCSAYPCERIQVLAQGYPLLLADGQRLRAIGVEAWIAEQEARARTGFAYVDIRCEPYEVPADGQTSRAD